MKTYYTIRKFNPITAEYSYYNSYADYAKAREMRDYLHKRYGGEFIIFIEEV